MSGHADVVQERGAEKRKRSPHSAADQLAAAEVGSLPADTSREDAVEDAVVGTVVFESVLLALRRLAQAHHSTQRFAATGITTGPDSAEGTDP